MSVSIIILAVASLRPSAQPLAPPHLGVRLLGCCACREKGFVTGAVAAEDEAATTAVVPALHPIELAVAGGAVLLFLVGDPTGGHNTTGLEGFGHLRCGYLRLVNLPVLARQFCSLFSREVLRRG